MDLKIKKQVGLRVTRFEQLLVQQGGVSNAVAVVAYENRQTPATLKFGVTVVFPSGPMNGNDPLAGTKIIRETPTLHFEVHDTKGVTVCDNEDTAERAGLQIPQVVTLVGGFTRWLQKQ